MAEERKEILLVKENPNKIEHTQRALKKEGLPNKVHISKHRVEALDYFVTPSMT